MRYPYDWTCALMTEKLFKRCLFQDVFFEEGNIIDDEYFTYQGIMKADKILRDDKVVYNYRQRGSSVMNDSKTRERILLNQLDFQNKRRKIISAQYPKLRRYFDMNYLEALIRISTAPYNTTKTLGMIKNQVWDYFTEAGNSIPGIRIVPALLKLIFTDENRLMKQLRKPVPENEQRKRFS